MEGVIFLRGHRVILRPLRKKTDMELCHRWINDPDTRIFLNRPLPTSIAQQEAWFDTMISRESDIILGIETHDGVFIGSMGLHHINWIDRTAVTGAVIGHPDYRSKGYGTDAKMTLLAYAFLTLNLRKICSTVIAYNSRSAHYNEKCGYQLEGVKKQHIYKEGEYHDELHFAVFREDWLEIWEEYKNSC